MDRDLDLRKLRYFAAVAEQRHFGRAAEQLYITQPVLSRQIRALEQELGAALLTRTTRSVELTPAGEQLHEEARRILPSVRAALDRVHEAGRGVQRLVVAFVPGLHVADAIREFTARYPDTEVDLLPLCWWEQDAPLRDGRADVGHLRRPFDDTGLRTVPTGREPKDACMPVSHPLASRTSLTLADLDGEEIIDTPMRRTTTLEEKFEHIASGHGLALVPRSILRTSSRADLVHIPVTDAETVATCLAVSEDTYEGRYGGGYGDRRAERVRAFVHIATETLPGVPPGAGRQGVPGR